MQKKSINEFYHQCWYSLSANRLLVTLGALRGEINCDVCVVGGGFTGISAALELAEKGMSVVLIEASDAVSGASGRSGGQMCRGFDVTPDVLVARYGEDDAR